MAAYSEHRKSQSQNYPRIFNRPANTLNLKK